MRVFLTGGTGFVGSEVLRQLTEAGHEVRALVRPGSEGKLAIHNGVEVQRGDVTQPETLQGALSGCQAVINLVGIIREYPAKGITFQRLHVAGTRNLLAAAGAQGVRRYLQMSANGTRENADSAYHRTKWLAEEAVRASRLDWTIFRPSLIFGPGSEFVEMLAGLVRRLPIVPVIGDGQYRMSPVAVEDVAASFARALEQPAAVRQTYHCCGPTAYTYDEVLDLVGAGLRAQMGAEAAPAGFPGAADCCPLRLPSPAFPSAAPSCPCCWRGTSATPAPGPRPSASRPGHSRTACRRF